MSLKVSAAVYGHIGHRPNNEDNFYYNGVYLEREQMNKGGRLHSVVTEPTQIYAACDGMGGAELGEEASLKAVQMIKTYAAECPNPDNADNISDLVARASDAVDVIALSRGLESGDCGSTIALLILKDWYYRTAHVGDSRVYWLRHGKLARITKDDSEVQMMVDQGQITLDEAWSHPLKNVITKHLGMPLEKDEKLKPTISIRKAPMPGDRFLICSDGLSDQLHDSVIAQQLMAAQTPVDAVTTLVQGSLRAADESGVNSDNITVMVLDILKIGEKDENNKRIRKMAALKWLLIAAIALLAGGLGWAVYDLVRLLIR